MRGQHANFVVRDHTNHITRTAGTSPAKVRLCGIASMVWTLSKQNRLADAQSFYSANCVQRAAHLHIHYGDSCCEPDMTPLWPLFCD